MEIQFAVAIVFSIQMSKIPQNLLILSYPYIQFLPSQIGRPSECLPCRKKTEKTPTGVRHRWLTSHAGLLIMEAPIRDDENALSPKGKARRAFYPKLPDEDAWFDSSSKELAKGEQGH